MFSKVIVLLFGAIVALMPCQILSEEILESLDAYICLRSSGFFPHDSRCDHFYECRNNTIVNEGICKQGLRFDYRYRKKPRCIPSDQIDCRITQLSDLYNSNLYNHNHDDQSQTTSLTTVTPPPTTTPAPTFPTPVFSHPFTARTSRNAHSTTPTTSRPTTTITATSVASTTTTDSPLSPPTTTTTTELSTTPRHVSRSNSNNNFHRQHNNRNHRNHQNRPKSATITSSSSASSIGSNQNQLIPNSDEDNTLTKKRKLTNKPLKLRRGHLQENQASSGGAGGSGFTGEDSRGSTLSHDEYSNSIAAADDLYLDQPRARQSLVPRAASSPSLSPIYRPLGGHPKSSHCVLPHGYYADRDDCRKFYACDDGRAFPMSCPLGLAYDETTGTCNWPDMVEGCRSEEMLRFNCPEAGENEILDYGDPRYPTSDCRKFVVCVMSELYGNRTPRLLGCEEGLVFNPSSRSCDYPENVPSCANYYDSSENSLFRRSISGKKRRVRH